MSEQHKKAARRVFEEIMSKGNITLVDDIVADRYVGHMVIEDIRGPEGAKQFGTMLRDAFPDLRFTVEDQIEEGNEVVTRWTCSGTQRGEFQGVPPTGKKVTISGISIFRFDDGKVAEEWSNPDLLGMMQQLGALG